MPKVHDNAVRITSADSNPVWTGTVGKICHALPTPSDPNLSLRCGCKHALFLLIGEPKCLFLAFLLASCEGLPAVLSLVSCLVHLLQSHFRLESFYHFPLAVARSLVILICYLHLLRDLGGQNVLSHLEPLRSRHSLVHLDSFLLFAHFVGRHLHNFLEAVEDDMVAVLGVPRNLGRVPFHVLRVDGVAGAPNWQLRGGLLRAGFLRGPEQVLCELNHLVQRPRHLQVLLIPRLRLQQISNRLSLGSILIQAG
mmetsp:Transcript_14821/g.28540  ORF Transcript_14821/g.28540 Transcript_14821/m.28540 type:complete len:253 (-) Transcript_14821:137-895(-)